MSQIELLEKATDETEETLRRKTKKVQSDPGSSEMPRYFVRFPDAEMRMQANAMLEFDPTGDQPKYAETVPEVMVATLSDEERLVVERNGATVYEDIQFQPTPLSNEYEEGSPNFLYWEQHDDESEEAAFMGPNVPKAAKPWGNKSLNDVLDHIRAPKAWATARGAGVTIGIVDTGISAKMKEFPAAKRSQWSKAFAFPTGPWDDGVGHGSMCACIAAGTKAAGGKYDGVAPNATLLSARSNLTATDIFELYDWVLACKRNGQIAGPLVMSNSYGLYRCSPPEMLAEKHPYLQILLDAVAANVVVVFAAGNNHYNIQCNHDPKKCSPDTIWSVNSRDEFLSVGTVNWDGRNDSGIHANSSRGPGQWANKHKKPDCVAPTYGEVIWGDSYRTMEWWGTSGACPQVAGLAALLLSADPTLSPPDIAELIRKTCDPLDQATTCVGKGIINCESALAKLRRAVKPLAKPAVGKPPKPTKKGRKSASKRRLGRKKPSAGKKPRKKPRTTKKGTKRSVVPSKKTSAKKTGKKAKSPPRARKESRIAKKPTRTRKKKSR